MDDKKESICHAALILEGKLSIGSHIADQRLRRLLEHDKTLENLYRTYHQQLEMFPNKTITMLEKKVENIEFKTITINSPEYPDWLKKLNTTPVLYAQGNLELLNNKTIAVVGTRHPEPEDIFAGIKAVQQLSEYTIVSGLAMGCDTIGHTNAQTTIAVIGTPLDKHYPPVNHDLQNRIAKEHLLITPFPIGITTYPGHFAYRNQLTVSLSKEGILVIRADDQSGTKHAIKHALKQGKKVYALPNNYGKGYKWTRKAEKYDLH